MDQGSLGVRLHRIRVHCKQRFFGHTTASCARGDAASTLALRRFSRGSTSTCPMSPRPASHWSRRFCSNTGPHIDAKDDLAPTPLRPSTLPPFARCAAHRRACGSRSSFRSPARAHSRSVDRHRQGRRIDTTLARTGSSLCASSRGAYWAIARSRRLDLRRATRERRALVHAPCAPLRREHVAKVRPFDERQRSRRVR